jgi:hypothetical protein
MCRLCYIPHRVLGVSWIASGGGGESDNIVDTKGGG